MNNYGQCPLCGANGTTRERSPDGSTTCTTGHKTKTRDWVVKTQAVLTIPFYQMVEMGLRDWETHAARTIEAAHTLTGVPNEWRPTADRSGYELVPIG
jgi:hypothetical protein